MWEKSVICNITNLWCFSCNPVLHSSLSLCSSCSWKLACLESQSAECLQKIYYHASRKLRSVFKNITLFPRSTLNHKTIIQTISDLYSLSIYSLAIWHESFILYTVLVLFIYSCIKLFSCICSWREQWNDEWKVVCAECSWANQRTHLPTTTVWVVVTRGRRSWKEKQQNIQSFNLR